MVLRVAEQLRGFTVAGVVNVGEVPAAGVAGAGDRGGTAVAQLGSLRFFGR
jgi:hypothetical protein